MADRFEFTLSAAVEALVQADEAKAILARAERERSAELVKRGFPEPDLEPATVAALRAFVQERVNKRPAKKGSKKK